MGGDHFMHASAARRYAAARPPHHDVVIDRIKRRLRMRGKSARALDVGCGTGMSATALTEIAKFVVGTDRSLEMLSRAAAGKAVQYVLCAAEALPFAPELFKIVTVSSAFHWFERGKFLAEAARVIVPGGWLIIYNNAFHAVMRENAGFRAAFRAAYPKRYPTPTRNWRQMTKDVAARHGFDFRSTEEYANDVAFSPGQLVDYLTTHSNVIAAVEGGGEDLESAKAWLRRLVTPLFTGPRGTFEFGGLIWYLRKRSLKSEENSLRSEVRSPKKRTP